ncbi:nucleotidyltransferase family protein [Maricaulaceae bacterium MS644]
MRKIAPCDQRDFLIEAVRADPIAEAILARSGGLNLPDWALAAGAVYQNVWNALTDRPPGHGVKDYDLAYHDATDLSFEAEDAVIQRCASAFADIPKPVEVRNQARVHLWFESRFGYAKPPYQSTKDGIANYAAAAHMVGLRRGADGAHTLLAPRGLDAVFAMEIAPASAQADTADFAKKSQRMRAVWPELRVVGRRS